MVGAPRGPSPALTTNMKLILVDPNLPVTLVNSQLMCLPPVGIFKPIVFI